MRNISVSSGLRRLRRSHLSYNRLTRKFGANRHSFGMMRDFSVSSGLRCLRDRISLTIESTTCASEGWANHRYIWRTGFDLPDGWSSARETKLKRRGKKCTTARRIYSSRFTHKPPGVSARHKRPIGDSMAASNSIIVLMLHVQKNSCFKGLSAPPSHGTHTTKGLSPSTTTRS